MLTHPLPNQLQELQLTGRFHALHAQLQMTALDHLSVEERFGLLVDRELTERGHPRGLDKALMQHLLSRRWLDEPLNGLITGPTGVGKPQPIHYPSR